MEAASKIPLLGGARGSGFSQKRHAAIIGVLALLGVVAMLAAINFQDEAGSGSLSKWMRMRMLSPTTTRRSRS